MAAEPGATASVDLTADSSSAGAARAFVRSVLSGWGCADELVDDALLAATELVTNALLYGSPPVAASLTFKAGGRVRISVRDGSPLLPALRKYGTNASTGRGLALVEAIGRWGAELGAGGGKVVWAELGGVVGTGEVPSPEAAPDDLDRQLVRFLGVPVVTYLALEAHNDAVLREFDLLALSSARGGSVPDRLLEIVREIRGQFSSPRAAYRRDVEAAARRGDALVDLGRRFTVDGVQPAVRYVELLEEAETFAGSGDLLLEPASPAVARLRRWFGEEMARQLRDGLPPEPAPQQAYPG